jgi:hypothetical protein
MNYFMNPQVRVARGILKRYRYLALLAAGTGSLTVAATRRWPRPALIFGAACLALAALAGVLSIGMLLVPAAVAAAAAAAGTCPRPHTSEPAR